MRKNLFVPLFGSCFAALLLLSGCRSEYETIRTSGDPQLLLKRGLEYYEEEEYIKSQGLLELALPSFRGKREAEDIYYKYAYTYYQTRQYLLASYHFNSFVQTFGASPLKEEVAFMAAYCNYKMSPTFRLDQTYTLKAIDELQLFANTYPASERVVECNKLIDELRAKLERKAFEEGKLYFDLRNYQSSAQVFENLLRDFPETKNIENVRFMILRATSLLADNSIFEKQSERQEETIAKANEYLARFPAGVNTREATQIREAAQRKLKQLENVGYQSKSARPGT